MKVLLDTHAFLWFISGDRRLSGRARDLIEDIENERYISIVSLWEIAIKTSIRKLRLAEPFDILIPSELQRNLIDVINLDITHVLRVANLPIENHREPYDRILAAQSLVEDIPLISVDEFFDTYGVKRLW